MVGKVAVILFCSSLSFAAQANEIFRWVDEKGKVHYGSSVPEKYRDKGKRLDSESPDDLKARRREAEARVAREKAAAEAMGKPRTGEPDSAKAGAAAKSPAAAAPKAKQLGSDASCADLWNEYKASIDCFAPYVRGNGTVRPEGFEKCPTIKQPVHCKTPEGISNR